MAQELELSDYTTIQEIQRTEIKSGDAQQSGKSTGKYRIINELPTEAGINDCVFCKMHSNCLSVLIIWYQNEEASGNCNCTVCVCRCSTHREKTSQNWDFNIRSVVYHTGHSQYLPVPCLWVVYNSILSYKCKLSHSTHYNVFPQWNVLQS